MKGIVSECFFLRYGTFCLKTLKYGTIWIAHYEQKMAHLRCEQTPHFIPLWDEKKWFLDGISCTTTPHICHLDHLYIGGEKIGHVEKFQISIHDRCGEIWNFSTCRGISDFSHNRCGEIWIFAEFGGISKFYTWQMLRNLKFTLFLVVKSVLWQFTLIFA